uniref:Uncharacterized protein n=1 Tax=Equus asinus TaxID=9793 RepID=A0A9L0K9H8_EQUAS
MAFPPDLYPSASLKNESINKLFAQCCQDLVEAIEDFPPVSGACLPHSLKNVITDPTSERRPTQRLTCTVTITFTPTFKHANMYGPGPRQASPRPLRGPSALRLGLTSILWGSLGVPSYRRGN